VIEASTAGELAALLEGAATLSRAGNRVAAIATLISATHIAPDDLTVHRRLAAAYAVAGDGESARGEYDRFIALLEERGAIEAAEVERSYAAILLAPPPPPARGLTADQTVALRRVAVALVAIVATLVVMFAAGAQIFASGGPR
jgi:DNA-binding SARP family transcriptional activator